MISRKIYKTTPFSKASNMFFSRSKLQVSHSTFETILSMALLPSSQHQQETRRRVYPASRCHPIVAVGTSTAANPGAWQTNMSVIPTAPQCSDVCWHIGFDKRTTERQTRTNRGTQQEGTQCARESLSAPPRLHGQELPSVAAAFRDCRDRRRALTFRQRTISLSHFYLRAGHTGSASGWEHLLKCHLHQPDTAYQFGPAHSGVSGPSSTPF